MIEWLSTNLINIIIIFATIVIGFLIYKLLKRQLLRRSEKEKLDERTGKFILKAYKYILILVVFSIILAQFSEAIGLIAGFISLSLGTILGFAAMNTLGNAIAGIIIMTSKPYIKGDRIIFEGTMAEVAEIKIIYTILKDLDGIKISVPNQKMLTDSIKNLGKESLLRIHATVTLGFDLEYDKAEKLLMDAVKAVPEIIENPKPYVRLTSFQNFAVEYVVYAFIRNPKALKQTESDLYKSIFKICTKNNIDLSTPDILRQLE